MEYDDSGRESRRYGNTGPGNTLNTVSTIGIIVGFLLLLNRLYWRWKKGTPGLDDILITFAWVFLLILGVVSLKAVDYGYGRHQSTLTRMEASDAERLFYIYQIFYKLTINTAKLSILTLYLRVFDTKDWFGRVTKILLFVVAAYTFCILVANVFICTPITLYWDTSPTTISSPSAATVRESSCINILAYWYASSLYNILSETLMLFSVLVRIWTLPSHSQPPILQFRQKINLTIVLGLGVFTTITAILRMTTLNNTAMSLDRTGGTLTSTIWSSIEASLGIAVANLPMIRQLLKWRGWCGGRWFSSTAGKSRDHSHSRRRSSRATSDSNYQQQPPIISLNRNPNNKHTNHNTVDEVLASQQQIRLQRDFERSVITSSTHSSGSGSSPYPYSYPADDIESHANSDVRKYQCTTPTKYAGTSNASETASIGPRSFTSTTQLNSNSETGVSDHIFPLTTTATAIYAQPIKPAYVKHRS